MDNFRHKLKTDNIVNIIGIVILIAFAGLAAYSEFSGNTVLNIGSKNEHFNSMWRGFTSGAACGIGAMMLFFLIRNLIALKDENKLKKLYIQESDERQKLICDTSRSSAGRTFLLLGMVVGIVAGFFSMAVGITIIACILFYALTSFGFMLYYGHKL